MLKITVPGIEFYDEERDEFITTKDCTLQLEHSLVSVSKWESKWHKSFINGTDKTNEELIDYIRCMTLTQNVNPIVYKCLTRDNIDQITDYINAPMTATWFSDRKGKKTQKLPSRRRQVTSELIYYWMIVCNIPFECQKWHLNRLMTLIRVCEEENDPPKRSKADMSRERAMLNKARRKRLNTKG